MWIPLKLAILSLFSYHFSDYIKILNSILDVSSAIVELLERRHTHAGLELASADVLEPRRWLHFLVQALDPLEFRTRSRQVGGHFLEQHGVLREGALELLIGQGRRLVGVIHHEVVGVRLRHGQLGPVILHHQRLLEGHHHLRVYYRDRLRTTTVYLLCHVQLLLLSSHLIDVGLADSALRTE